MSDYKNFLSENLRKLRLACGYTQDDVATVLGLSRPAYTYYETGKTCPDLEAITKLAKMFGVTLDQLIIKEEQPLVEHTSDRVRCRPSTDPQTIGELTNEEKQLIAWLRSVKK